MAVNTARELLTVSIGVFRDSQCIIDLLGLGTFIVFGRSIFFPWNRSLFFPYLHTRRWTCLLKCLKLSVCIWPAQLKKKKTTMISHIPHSPRIRRWQIRLLHLIAERIFSWLNKYQLDHYQSFIIVVSWLYST